MGRALLQADNLDIWRAEVQLAFGGVQVDRYVVRNQTASSFDIATLPIGTDEVVRAHVIVLAQDVVSNDAFSVELTGTFKNVGGSVFQVSTTTTTGTHADDTDWSASFTLADSTLSVSAAFASGSTGFHIVFNTYSYLHILSEL